MRIEKIKYKNHLTGWQLETTKFSDLTLLVGISGVGKTRILDIFRELKNIAGGASKNGVEWDFTFSVNGNKKYRWQGAFERFEEPDSKIFELPIFEDFEESDKFTSKQKSKINSEKLYLNKNLIIERNIKDGIKFRGTSLPKLSSYKSVLNLLNEEEDIAFVSNSIKKIIKIDDPIPSAGGVSNFDKLVKQMNTLEKIQESNMPVLYKLMLVYENLPDIFNEIKEDFRDAFPKVKDIKFKEIKASPPFGTIIILQIKEDGVEKWVSQDKISSGMLKTLFHIAEMKLLADGSVLLIDEFENSLGINCIDIVADTLMDKDRKIQFIITSHHPYIINKIEINNWKIVTRKGSVVNTKDAKECNLSKSKHEAFKQLINLPEFIDGIE